MIISEWILIKLLDFSKNEALAGIGKINQKDFNSILKKTLVELEGKYFGFSRASFKDFLKSSEFQTHIEKHIDDRELDFEYLGNILAEYVNLEIGLSGRTLMLDFFDKFEINLSREPSLKAQLELRYHKSTLHRIKCIGESISFNHDEIMKVLKCLIQKDVQNSNRKLCFHGQEVSDDQILKLATNALNRAKSKYEEGLSLTVLGEFDKAELQFNSAIEHNPACADCYVQRGNVRYIKKNYWDASRDYSKAVHLDPNIVEAWNIVFNTTNLTYHTRT